MLRRALPVFLLLWLVADASTAARDAARLAHRLESRIEQVVLELESAQREGRLGDVAASARVELTVSLRSFAEGARAFAALSLDRQSAELRDGGRLLVSAAEDLEWQLERHRVRGRLANWPRAWAALADLAETLHLPVRAVNGAEASPPPAATSVAVATGSTRPVRTVRGDRLRWRGRVGGTDRVHLRADTVDIQHLSLDLGGGSDHELSAPLPAERVDLELRQLSGRGTVRLVATPQGENRFTAIVEIVDEEPGTDEYAFELRW